VISISAACRAHTRARKSVASAIAAYAIEREIETKHKHFNTERAHKRHSVTDSLLLMLLPVAMSQAPT